MKSGNQQSKPVLSARPPVMVQRSSVESQSDLDKVQAITEEPARIAAQALGAGEGVEATVPAETTPVAPKTKPAKEAMPWDEAGEGVISFNFKLPAKLAAKLKYLGGSTYGESMTSIVTDAVSVRVEKMLKERSKSS